MKFINCGIRNLDEVFDLIQNSLHADNIRIVNVGEVGDYDNDLENKYQVWIDAEAVYLLEHADKQRERREIGEMCNAIVKFSSAKHGGKTGASKRRGDSEYYRQLALKSAETRRNKKP